MTVTALARGYPKNTVIIDMTVMQGVRVTVAAVGRGYPKTAVTAVTAVTQRAVTRRRKEDDELCPMQSCVSRNAKRAGDSGDGGDSDIGIPPVTVIDA